jgi:hypothetical protein
MVIKGRTSTPFSPIIARTAVDPTTSVEENWRDTPKLSGLTWTVEVEDPALRAVAGMIDAIVIYLLRKVLDKRPKVRLCREIVAGFAMVITKHAIS